MPATKDAPAPLVETEFSKENTSRRATPPRRMLTAQACIDAAVDQAQHACQAALDHTDPAYHGFFSWISQKKKVADDHGRAVYADIQLPYMAVDGRIRMAIDEHTTQGVALGIHTEFCTEPTSGHLLCRATVRSPLRGTVTAHARVFLGGSGVNTTNPLENGETSAIGRALGFLGYGLYGTGIASADEVVQARAARASAETTDNTPHASKPTPSLSPSVLAQKARIWTLLVRLYPTLTKDDAPDYIEEELQLDWTEGNLDTIEAELTKRVNASAHEDDVPF